MKKKIIFGLSIFALMFFFGSIYIVSTMQTTIYDLHRLSQLHYTITLRKDLLTGIRNNQNNIRLRGAFFAIETGSNGGSLAGIVQKCAACHNSPPTRDTI